MQGKEENDERRWSIKKKWRLPNHQKSSAIRKIFDLGNGLKLGFGNDITKKQLCMFFKQSCRKYLGEVSLNFDVS